MNTKLFIYCFLIAVIYSCKSTEETIQIKQVNNKFPIILMGDTIERQRVYRIKYPIGIKIENNSRRNRELLGIQYYYYNSQTSISNDTGWISGGALLYRIKENNQLQRVGKSSYIDERMINKNKSMEYIVYTGHSLDTSQINKVIFTPYLEQMKELKQDTLSINSIKEFENIYPDFFEELLKGDSIKFKFWGINEEPEVISFSLPVEYINN